MNTLALVRLANKVLESLQGFKQGDLSAYDALELIDLALWYSDFGEETPVLEATKTSIVLASLLDASDD